MKIDIDIDRFGLKNVQVDRDTLFTFPKGMAGFENCRDFKLFHQEGGGTVFWLQSVDDAKISFPIMAPDELDIDYEIELSDEDCELLGMKDPSEVADMAIGVVVYRDGANDEKGPIAANTRSPVIFNLKTRLGMQKVLREVHSSLTVRAR